MSVDETRVIFSRWRDFSIQRKQIVHYIIILVEATEKITFETMNDKM